MSIVEHPSLASLPARLLPRTVCPPPPSQIYICDLVGSCRPNIKVNMLHWRGVLQPGDPFVQDVGAFRCSACAVEPAGLPRQGRTRGGGWQRLSGMLVLASPCHPTVAVGIAQPVGKPGECFTASSWLPPS